MQEPVESSYPEKQTSDPRIKGDPGIIGFGASNLVRSVQALDQEIQGVRNSEDIEYIHRMRVASRRMRSSLSIFKEILPEKKQNEWARTIRKLTQALGEARDTDVQIELLSKLIDQTTEPKNKPGMNRLLLRLTQRRQQLQQDVSGSLDELEKSKTNKQIISRFEKLAGDAFVSSPALYQRAYTIINEKLNTFMSYEVYLRQPDNTAMLHAMRIAAKRLRYAMEIFASIYPDELAQPLQAARKSQQILGDLHDCDVWISFLPGFEEKERQRIQKFYGHSRPVYRIIPGIQYFLQNRVSARNDAYRSFLKVWRKWREDELWLGLREVILLSVPAVPYEQPLNMDTITPGLDLPSDPN
jgi:CHAD domain-containing protein